MLYQHLHDTLSPIIRKPVDIGILTSGGLDSTVLLYTCRMIKADIAGAADFHAFTVVITEEDAYVRNIISRIDTNIDHTILEYNSNVNENMRVRDALSAAKQMCDFLLLGDTANPSHLSDGPTRHRSTHRRYVQPFFDWTKDKIVALAKEINMPADLIRSTITCSNEPPCNRCWPCQERAWAFAANNLADPKMVTVAGLEPATRGV